MSRVLSTMNLLFIVLKIFMIIRLTKSSDLIEKTASIANDFYKPHLLTTVAWSNDDHDHVNEFLLKYRGAVTTIVLKECKGNCRKTLKAKQTVYFAGESEDFDNFLSITNNVTSEAVLVILVITNGNVDLIKFTNIALKRDVKDIVAVSTKLDGTIAVSTITPYGNGVCGDFSPRDVSQSDIFKKNNYVNFHGCPIRLTAKKLLPYVDFKKENGTVIAIDGIDANLVNLIIESLNATLNIVSASNRGDLGYFENGTARGAFADIYNNVADIIAPAMILTTKRYPAALMTPIHRPCHVVLCLPKREEIYKWAKVFLPFYNWSTPMIIAAAICFYSTLRFVKIFGQREYQLPQRIPFGIFSLFFGQFYNVNSRYWLINVLFIFWVWFSLIFRISYEGRLVEGLHHIILEPPVTTFEEAIQVVKEVRIHPTLMEFYRNTPIEKAAVPVTLRDLTNTLLAIGDGKKFLIAIDFGQVKIYKRNVQILKEPIINSPASIFLRPRWPAAEHVSTVMSRIIDTGQMTKIMNDIFTNWELQNSNKTLTLHVVPLGLNLLGSCFLGLIVMYFVCVLIFGAEMYHNYYIRRRYTIPLPFIH